MTDRFLKFRRQGMRYLIRLFLHLPALQGNQAMYYVGDGRDKNQISPGECPEKIFTCKG
jgi:hypothetical protein